MKRLLLLLSLLLTSGCNYQVSEKDLNKIKVCTDTRDGEVFSFDTSTMTNVVRTGTATATARATVVTESGRKITVESEWLKCADAENETTGSK